jgi:hypothetical protein
VTNDPASAEPTFQRVKQQSGMRQTWTYHVSFFGEPNRAWVVSLPFFVAIYRTAQPALHRDPDLLNIFSLMRDHIDQATVV